MKKIFLSGILIVLLLTGCGKKTQSDVINDLTKKIGNLSSYYIEGEMEIVNNEDTYTYEVTASYKKGDYYKVTLNNTLNNHKQVILRNDDGVYVITPSLNKSFKFQSDWPYNNSQVYLLGSIIDDLNTDSELEFAENENGYILTSAVNYPNNKKLVKQNVILDKDSNIMEVNVLDENGNVQIKMLFSKIDVKPNFDNDTFKLSSIVDINNQDSKEDNNSTDNTETTATIDDVIYPMYLPDNTYLTNQETVNTETGQRLILTFDGDNPFTLIEETVSTSSELTIIPTFGEVEQLADCVGILSDNSVNWFSNGIEYYVVSDIVSTSELLDIARSISVIPVANLK